jgi:hypothetical protein
LGDDNIYLMVRRLFPEGTPYDDGERKWIAEWGNTPAGNPFNEGLEPEPAADNSDVQEQTTVSEPVQDAPKPPTKKPVIDEWSEPSQNMIKASLGSVNPDGRRWVQSQPSQDDGGLKPLDW